MFISGHINILKEILKNNKYEKINKYYKKLKNGIIYIDLPCGKYKKINNNFYLYKKNVCYSYKLYKLLNKRYGYSNIYQNHRGFFSHLHSMTTDPSNNVEKIN